MSSKRVYELAKDRGISSEALVKMLHEAGHLVKSHMSIASDEVVEWVSKKFAEEKEAAKQDIVRQRKAAEARPLETPAPVDPSAKPAAEEEDKDVLTSADAVRLKPGEATRVVIGTGKKKVVPGAQGAANKGRRPDTPSPRPTNQERRKRRDHRPAVEKKVVTDNVKRTLAIMDGGARTKHHRRRTQSEGPMEPIDENLLQVPDFISVAELAERIGCKPKDIIEKCFNLGLMVTINQRMDFDTIEMVADEFGFKIERISQYDEVMDLIEDDDEEEQDYRSRPPVITIMGHVDHGKTSLLDYIRKTHVAAGETGGITQHIGAYQVPTGHGKITFLDTPGHEAFTAMRARGAQVTDIVVLVVAANDGVMPQTIEAINHAKAAGVPIVVAINKIDLPEANALQVKSRLADYGVTIEEYGGTSLCIEVSAKKGINVDQLLESLALQSEILELKAPFDGRARGIVIEAQMDKGKGPMATILVQRGVLNIGDVFVCGDFAGRVRIMLDDRGQRIQSATPATPIQIVGLEGVPQAGDTLLACDSDSEARAVANRRQLLRREEESRRVKRVTLANWNAMKESHTLALIVKGDVDGSVEVLRDTLERLSTEEVKVHIIHSGVGIINESDINLARASDAIILGFHVGANPQARDLATQLNVEIRLYQLIFEAESEIRAAMEGLLTPEKTEETAGEAEVRDVFRVAKLGTIAGCQVVFGSIRRGFKAKVMRKDVELARGTITSLKRFKDDAKEVNNGLECGIGVEGVHDFQPGDRIVTYQIVETMRKLQVDR